MKKSLHAALMCGALALSFGLATAGAQESLTASDAENGNLYFVELSGAPTADGNSLANVRAEKTRFKTAAALARVDYSERRSFDVLFNGLTVRASPSQRAALAGLPGVKAIWSVEVIEAPEFNPGAGAAPDLAAAIAMTGADVVQNSLGYTGAGIRVAVMDTGIDYDHAGLGGDGVQRSNSAVFPTSRVVAGWDFVGDAFTGGNTPVPDAFPDDCNGHGTHVSGIVGANGAVTGVAPDVVFGAYRVFGCDGSTTADIMLAAMERALADGMQVLNMSIGSRAQWPQYPTGAAATRLLKKGMVVVASIGNNGPGGSAPDGPYAAGAPGVGADVIGVASYDNTHSTQLTFTVTPGGETIAYNRAAASPPSPTSGSLPMARTGTTTTTKEGCAALPAGSLAGMAVLIRRGTCFFVTKAFNAQSAGAAAVVIYNNVAGAAQNITVAGPPSITIPVVAITNTNGALLDSKIAAGPTTLNWTANTVSTPIASGGLISGFSSFGMAADLTLKPDIGAPGGSIFSTIPLELGGYGNNSGTSMSSPHVAGAVALLLQAEPKIRPSAVRSRLQNSAKPSFWSGNPALGFLDYAHRQGAGLLDIEDAILATVEVTPGKLSLGESQAGPQKRRLKIRNRGASSVTLDLSHVTALATGPKSQLNYAAVSTSLAPATVAFSAASVTVPAGESSKVDVTITANPALVDQGQYGGYIVLTPQGGGRTYRVPFAGFKGDYQTVPVLTPGFTPPPLPQTAIGFPWLAKLIGPRFFNRPTGATYTMVGDDIPFFLIHLDHQSERVHLTVAATNGQPFFSISDDLLVPRNTSAAGFFAFTWDGTTFRSKGHDDDDDDDNGHHGDGNGHHGDDDDDDQPKVFTVPNGSYVVTVTVSKALGSRKNPAHFETWTSPVVTIARP